MRHLPTYCLKDCFEYQFLLFSCNREIIMKKWAGRGSVGNMAKLTWESAMFGTIANTDSSRLQTSIRSSAFTA